MTGRQFSPSAPVAAADLGVRSEPQGALTHPNAATIGSAAVATVALIAGDAAMAGVVAGAKAIVPGPASVAWFAAAAVIAIGSYTLVGIPQIALGRRHGDNGSDDTLRDRRGRWAIRLLDRNRSRRQGMVPTAAFVVASIAAGPLAIGWFAGRRQHPNAHRRTAVSAAVFGATWAAAYLGAIAAIF